MINYQRNISILLVLPACAMLPLQSSADANEEDSILRLPPIRQESQAPAKRAKEGSVRIVGMGLPLLSGSAGRGTGAPDYDDAFSNGVGVALEYHRRMSDRFSIVAGIGYDSFDGETYQGISFDDLNRYSLYYGAKIHFSAERIGWQPYGRVDLGAASTSSVDVSLRGTSGAYWDSSWALLVDAGAGIENRFGDWSAFGEILFRYVGKPDSALRSASDADGSWTLPIRLGVGYHF